MSANCVVDQAGIEYHTSIVPSDKKGGPGRDRITSLDGACDQFVLVYLWTRQGSNTIPRWDVRPNYNVCGTGKDRIPSLDGTCDQIIMFVDPAGIEPATKRL